MQQEMAGDKKENMLQYNKQYTCTMRIIKIFIIIIFQAFNAEIVCRRIDKNKLVTFDWGMFILHSDLNILVLYSSLVLQ